MLEKTASEPQVNERLLTVMSWELHPCALVPLGRGTAGDGWGQHEDEPGMQQGFGCGS